jgi:hypothetical protein
VKTWTRVDATEFVALDLHAHALLEDVPLHDVWRVSLPGGGPERTLADVRGLLHFDELSDINPVVRGLFALRTGLGRVFRAGDGEPIEPVDSFLRRVPSELLAASAIAPGTPEGPFRVLYALADEGLSEIRNATVHAFSALALRPEPGGYRLYWAIYVAPVGAITRFYMALIDPFRRFLVYPAVLRHVRRRWIETHPTTA